MGLHLFWLKAAVELEKSLGSFSRHEEKFVAFGFSILSKEGKQRYKRGGKESRERKERHTRADSSKVKGTMESYLGRAKRNSRIL